MVARSARVGIPVVALLLWAAAASPAAAQEISYTTTTRVEFGSGGFFGGLLTRAADAAGPSTEAVHIRGRQMRTDSDGSSTIFDLDAGQVVFLDHESRTYAAMTLDELQAMARASVEALQAGLAADPDDPDEPGADVEVEFELAVERSGERATIQGANAERVFITLQVKATRQPDDVDDDEVSGTLVVFSDLWQSTDFAGYRAREQFAAALGDAFRSELEGLGSAIGQALMADPRMAAGLEEAGREAESLEGETLRGVIYVVSVPDGAEFDRRAVLGQAPAEAEPEPERRGGLRGLARGLQQAVQAQPGDAADEPGQVRLLTVTTEVTDVSTGTVPASLFEIPDGYREMRRDGRDPS